MTDTTRRAVVKGVVWAAPVVALAVVLPSAVASGGCESQTYIFDPRTTSLEKGKNDAAKITVVTGSHIEVEYIRDIGHPHVNIRRTQTSGTENNHYPSEVEAGTKFLFPLDSETCMDPDWIQAAGNNVHYYAGGLFT